MRFVLFTIGLIGAGLLGAVFGQVLFPAKDVLAERSEDYSRLTAQVEDLAAEMDSLRTELREERASRPLPEMGIPPAIAAPGGLGAEPGVTIIETAPDGVAYPNLMADAVIEEKVRETVNQIAREQRAEAARKAEAEAVAKETAWLKEMQPHIGMTDYQVEELGKLVRERRHNMAGFKQKTADFAVSSTPQQKAALQQAISDYRAILKAEVLKVVSQDQYEGIIRWSEDKRKRDRVRNR